MKALKGGKFHPRLNMSTRPIANKYREGKVKRTLKRELKVLEIVKGEANIAVEYVPLWIVYWLGSQYKGQGNRFLSLLSLTGRRFRGGASNANLESGGKAANVLYGFGHLSTWWSSLL